MAHVLNSGGWGSRARLLAIGAVAMGVYIPIVQNTRGQSWTIVGAAAWISYVILVAAAVGVIFETDMPAAVGRKAGWIGAAALGCIAIYACNQFSHGLTFFVYQTAGELASDPSVNKGVYWKTLYELTGSDGQIPMFGDLRTAHDSLGDQFTLNGRHFFWDVINSLSMEDARHLASLPGGFYLVMSFGMLLVLLGALANAWLLVFGIPARWRNAIAIAPETPSVVPATPTAGDFLHCERRANR
jgi:hypothetical protein